MKIEDRLDCLEAIINELDIKTPISPNTLYDLQLHISMAQTEVKKLNIPDVMPTVCPACGSMDYDSDNNVKRCVDCYTVY